MITAYGDNITIVRDELGDIALRVDFKFAGSEVFKVEDWGSRLSHRLTRTDASCFTGIFTLTSKTVLYPFIMEGTEIEVELMPFSLSEPQTNKFVVKTLRCLVHRINSVFHTAYAESLLDEATLVGTCLGLTEIN